MITGIFIIADWRVIDEKIFLIFQSVLNTLQRNRIVYFSAPHRRYRGWWKGRDRHNRMHVDRWRGKKKRKEKARTARWPSFVFKCQVLLTDSTQTELARLFVLNREFMRASRSSPDLFFLLCMQLDARKIRIGRTRSRKGAVWLDTWRLRLRNIWFRSWCRGGSVFANNE